MKYLLILLFITISINFNVGNNTPSTDKCPCHEKMKRCGTVCERTCLDINGTRPCPRICPKPACSCVNEYVRGPNGMCILPKDCPRQCTSPNQVWMKCGYNKTCMDNNANSSSECHPGCFCKEGLVQHPNGTCVEHHECPNCNWETEVYQECGTACPNTCINFNATHRPLCPALCVSGCFCKKELVLDNDKNCIKPEKCPPRTCEGDHEIYDKCGTLCPDTCRNLGTLRKCVADCIEGCFCEEGFVRSDNGDCRLPCDCPLKETCTKPYDNYTECGSKNGQTCDNYWVYQPSNDCEEACLCDEGYVRNKEFCVKPEDCPDLCNSGEQYLTCGPFQEKTCENLNDTTTSSKECGHPGCYCNKDLVRLPNGICAESYKCPNCDWKTEVYQTCGTACPANCSNYLEQYRPCTKNCVSGCFCKNGLVLDGEHHKCIKPENCPVTPNENRPRRRS